MNKKIATFSIIGLLALTLVSAILVYEVTRDVEVSPSFTFSGDNADDVSIAGGESVYSNLLSVESETSVNVPLSIETMTDPDTSEVSHTTRYYLDVSGVAGTEERVVVTGEDSVMNLVDLDSIEWDVSDGIGYAPHVDVFLDNGETLVFEYAKVDPLDCDDSGDYPTGDFNTFNDKGIVDDSAYAWLSSGLAGACGVPEFEATYNSLSDWKSEYPDAKIVMFQFEVDNWIIDSSAKLSNILINGAEVQPTLLPDGYLNFDVESEFSIATTPDTYTITTSVEPRI